MSLQELPRTVATGTVKLIRLPLELANGARELIADRIGGDENGEPTDTMPTTAPRKPKPAKPKTAKPKAAKPKAGKPKRTPAAKSPAAEKPEVVAEQTEGLEDATDRAIAERRSLR